MANAPQPFLSLRGVTRLLSAFTLVSFATMFLAGCAGDGYGSEAEAASDTSADAPADESFDYRVDPAWPALPADLEVGEVAGVATDSQGHVFVFHRGDDRSVLRLDPASGEIVSSFGDGMFMNAHGLEVDGDDNVWVTDTLRHQVMKFSRDGELLLTLGEREVSGLDGDHFNLPTDVAINSNGEIYVSDGYGNSRVAKFAADGTFLFDWGEKGSEPGQFDLPHGITLDDAGRVYVADRTNQRVQVFEADGTFVEQWGEDVFGEGSRPWGLEFFQGRFYVIDGGNMNPETPDFAQLTIVEDGQVVARWSGYGEAPGELSWGHDVAVGSDGSVYTAEVRNNNRAQRYVR